MRLCKGDFVEVLRKEEVPTGSWHCAEVICGNGHTYTVKYDLFRATGDEALTERVPRKALRPCPPPVVLPDNWVPGDHVEVYHKMSWKTATVMKYLDQHMYIVRLLGELWEFEVHRSYLRVRQSWEDGKWFTIGKGGCAMPMKKNYTNTKTQLSVGQALKRASPVSLTNLEEDTSYSQKTGLTETGRSQKRLKRSLAEHLSPLSGKVDNCIYPQENLGGNFVHTLLDVGKNDLSVSNLDMIESNQFNHAHTCATRSFGTNSGVSSVGSCSINDDVFGYEHAKDDLENLCSDAESFGGWGNDGSCHVEKNVELYEHRLNLLLYRSALRSLYASGPLSWEDEMKMVDLRDALKISNDEHLVEIKSLISADIRIPAS